MRKRVFIFLGSISILLVIAITIFYFIWIKPYLPDISEIEKISLSTPMKVYSNDGKTISEFGERRRYIIEYGEIPQKLVDSLLVIEDNRFYEHNGIDFISIIRAFISLIRTGEKSQGASTITMQLARNFFLTREKSYIRKIREIFLAQRIESVYTKDEILTLYMNRVFLGHRSYGFKAAAQTYFGRPLEELSWGENAMLAGIPKAPSSLNPVTNPEKAQARRNLILSRLKNLSYINEKTYQQEILKPIQSSLARPTFEVDAGHAAEMVRILALKYLPNLKYDHGIKVYTTISSKHQKAANKAVRKGLIKYIRRNYWTGPEQIQIIDFDASLLTQKVFTKLINLTQRAEHIFSLERAIIYSKRSGVHLALESGKVVTLNDEERQWAESTWRLEDSDFIRATATHKQYLSDIEAISHFGKSGVFYIPQLTSETKKAQSLQEALPIGGIVYINKINNKYQLVSKPKVQGALVSLNPKNGAILSLVGGFNFVNFKFNRVTQAKRQVGSNFKPFLYSVALENGMTAATIINDAPIAYQDQDTGFIWTPKNYSKRYFGPTRLRQALIRSSNLVSVRILRELGLTKIVEYAKNFGFSFENFAENYNLSVSLGSSPMTPLRLVTGYAVFANGGYLITPHLIKYIEDADGNVIYTHQPKVVCYTPCPKVNPDNLAPRTMSQTTNYIMNDIMRNIMREGTGRSAKVLNRKDIAGKTGTTNSQIDVWFSGFNRSVVTTVWMGNDESQPMSENETGSKTALPIWIDYMKEVIYDTPETLPPQPIDIVKARINKITGKFTKSDNPKTTMMEIFRASEVPNDNDEKQQDTNNKFNTRPSLINSNDTINRIYD